MEIELPPSPPQQKINYEIFQNNRQLFISHLCRKLQFCHLNSFLKTTNCLGNLIEKERDDKKKTTCSLSAPYKLSVWASFIVPINIFTAGSKFIVILQIESRSSVSLGERGELS